MASNRGVGGKAGGGIKSNKLVHKPVRYGEPAKGTRHEGVSQIGSSLGDHATETGKVLRKSVERMHGDAPHNAGQRLGNEVAATTVCGPGGSRTVMKSGSQGVQGSVNPGSPGLPSTKGQWPDDGRR